MASGKDTYHEKHPELNRNLKLEGVESSGRARRPATARVMSGFVQRLARKLDANPDELASRIPNDTIRRTKHPVVEEAQPDGSVKFKEPHEVIEGPISLIQK